MNGRHTRKPAPTKRSSHTWDLPNRNPASSPPTSKLPLPHCEAGRDRDKKSKWKAETPTFLPNDDWSQARQPTATYRQPTKEEGNCAGEPNDGISPEAPYKQAVPTELKSMPPHADVYNTV